MPHFDFTADSPDCLDSAADAARHADGRPAIAMPRRRDCAA